MIQILDLAQFRNRAILEFRSKFASKIVDVLFDQSQIGQTEARHICESFVKVFFLGVCGVDHIQPLIEVHLDDLAVLQEEGSFVWTRLQQLLEDGVLLARVLHDKHETKQQMHYEE